MLLVQLCRRSAGIKGEVSNPLNGNKTHVDPCSFIHAVKTWAGIERLVKLLQTVRAVLGRCLTVRRLHANKTTAANSCVNFAVTSLFPPQTHTAIGSRSLVCMRRPHCENLTLMYQVSNQSKAHR